MNNIKFIQINLHHAKGATGVLCQRFKKENFSVALIQEPWAHKSRVLGINSLIGKLIYDENSSKPRTAILIKGGIKFVPITQFITKDIVVIRLEIPTSRGKTEAYIASAYFPGDGDTVPPPELADFVNYCKMHNKYFIIGCDANSHHTIWGSTNINKRGEDLFEYISSNNMDLCNKGDQPTFVTKVRQEVLDLTMCSPVLSTNIKNWHVSDDESLSDHKHIVFEYIAGALIKIAFKNPRNTNWERYASKVQFENITSDNVIESTEQLDRIAENITEKILQAYDASCPVKEELTSRDVPWWNKTLNNLRKKSRQLFNHAKVSGQWDQYKKVLTMYNKEIRKSKRRTWRSYCENMEKTPDVAKLQKVLSKDHSNGLGTVRKTNGKFTVDTQETLKIMMETHFPGSYLASSEDERGAHIDESCRPTGTISNSSIPNTIFTRSKVEWAINSFEPFKSPGKDGIFPALLQKGGEALIDYLTNIFKASLTFGHIPKIWTQVRVVFIPKAGKKDKTNPKSFRPISLTSTMLKIMEKIIDEYIKSEYLRTIPLNRFQFAYQPYKSTVTALHNLVTKIESTLDKKEIALVAFLDVEGAFDNTTYKSIKKSMDKRNFDPSVRVWIMKMLKSREVSSELGESSITIRTTKGCPQGGVLSPLLWSLVVDDILNKLVERGFEVIGFADDIAIIVRGKFDNIITDRMQSALNCTVEWCQNEGLNINPSKTVLVPFTRKRKITLKSLIINGSILQYSSSVKYLGVILDDKLNWSLHLEQVISKATNALWVSKKTFGKKWGLKPKMIHWIYTVIVRPRIVYASFVWWPKTNQITSQQKLAKFQRLVCMAITGAMHSTPSKALEAVLYKLPLHQYVQMEAERSALRLRRTTIFLEGNLSGHLSILKDFRIDKTVQMIEDWMEKILNLDKPYEVINTNRQIWESGGPIISPGSIIFYTDGSKMNDSAGAGIIGPGIHVSIPMGRWTTVFFAEVYAILECAYICLKRNYRHARICIFSDSQAALNALKCFTCQSKLVWECITILKQLAMKNQVHLYWVPGHCGIEGNEKADLLARQGASSQYVGPEPFCGISKCVTQLELKQWKDNMIQFNWKAIKNLRQSKLFITPNKQITEKILNLNKKSLRIFIGLLTGHCPARYHLKKISRSQIDVCRFCGCEKETSQHLLCDCPALFASRKKYFNKGILNPSEIWLQNPNLVVKFILKVIPDWDNSHHQITAVILNGNSPY